jgi:hypothetical protein
VPDLAAPPAFTEEESQSIAKTASAATEELTRQDCRDCRFCQERKRKRKLPEQDGPIPWYLKKGKGGRKKKIVTAGYFSPNENCEYYGISDEQTHALVGYGRHGVHEEIRDYKCQACGKKFTARRNTVLYRLKSHSGLVEKILWLMALGVDAAVASQPMH